MSKGYLSSHQNADQWGSENKRQARDFYETKRATLVQESGFPDTTAYTSPQTYHKLRSSPWDKGGEPPSMVGASHKPMPKKPGPMNAHAEMIY